MLLGVLGVILLVSGYVVLFYMPVTAERDRCLSEAESVRTEIEAAQIRLDDKHRMERELEELFAQDPPPLSIADYDNLQSVMFELNSILSGALDYSLTFSTVDTSQTIVRRDISMSFSCGSYEIAEGILQQLHDSAYRCMLDSVSMSMERWEGGFLEEERYDGTVAVSGNIVFFEYQASPAVQDVETAEEMA